MDWSIGRILRELYPESGLRQRFRNEPYLDEVSLRQVLNSPFAMTEFLVRCRSLPQCGEVSINRLHDMIKWASEASAARQLSAVSAH